MAGDARRGVADDLLAHVRPQSVGADQGRAGNPVARCQRGGDRAAILIVPGNLGAGAQVDQRAVLAGFQQHAVQVAAMDHRIGVAEAGPERIVERHHGDRFGGHRVHQAQFVDIDRHRPRRIADAEPVEGVEGVRAKLDAGADLAELRCLFEHDRGESGAREPERRGQPADAAAGDENGKGRVAGGAVGHAASLAASQGRCRSRQRVGDSRAAILLSGYANI